MASMMEQGTPSTHRELGVAISSFNTEDVGQQIPSSGCQLMPRGKRLIIGITFVVTFVVGCLMSDEGCPENSANVHNPDFESPSNCDLTNSWRVRLGGIGMNFAHGPMLRNVKPSNPAAGHMPTNVVANPSLPHMVKPQAFQDGHKVDDLEEAPYASTIPAVQPRSVAPQMSLALGATILRGASQGAVAAAVAATLSAFTEPVINRVLVERVTVAESIKRMDMKKSIIFWKTTMFTNFLKFPTFEAVNAVMELVQLNYALKGVITGLVFTTVSLPITNFRFCQSMELPINTEALFKAYLPTVFRDILYSISRNKLQVAVSVMMPALATGAFGQAAILGLVVFGACVLSSPGNELRGYSLQPKDKRKSFGDFFKPGNYARSTFAGSLIMGISLFAGSLMTAALKGMVAIFRK